MPRQIRIVIPHEAHHITQRGNYRQEIFEDDNDFKQYLIWLNEYSKKHKIDILAYCLMMNHVHIIGTPENEKSFGNTLNTLAMRYSQHVNRKRKSNGHVWQGRFFSCILDEAHLYRAIRYVENNPVRAKMVKNAWNYRWSSAQTHVGMGEKSIITLKSILDMKPTEWKAYLKEDDAEMTSEMRLKTRRGLVVGKEAFVKGLEKKLGRSLKCLDPGRPKKGVDPF